MNSTKIRIHLSYDSHQMFGRREAWTLSHMLNAGARGLTPIDHPAPRWSHYVYELGRAGLTISIEYEPRSGSFPSTHGRYRLKTVVSVVSEGEA
jgi:hypothetical protein